MNTYKDIYEDRFLELFNEKRNEFEEIKYCIENPKIDLDNIAEMLGLTIEEAFFFNESGKIIDEEKKIYVNALEYPYRKRFTIAHEMGHFILGHSGESFRKLSIHDYDDFFEKSKERSANQFAADLLMPAKSLMIQISKYVRDRAFDKEHDFNESEIDEMLAHLSMAFEVSKPAMRIRVNNLEIFTEEV